MFTKDSLITKEEIKTTVNVAFKTIGQLYVLHWVVRGVAWVLRWTIDHIRIV